MLVNVIKICSIFDSVVNVGYPLGRNIKRYFVSALCCEILKKLKKVNDLKRSDAKPEVLAHGKDGSAAGCVNCEPILFRWAFCFCGEEAKDEKSNQ